MKRASHGHDGKDVTQGSAMKKQRESQCTQKTISLLSPLGTIQVSGCENGVHTIQILMDVAPAERSAGAPLSCVVNDSPAETSPELQRGVEWLQAYFSEPRTTGRLPLPAFHHPALQGDAFTSRVLHVLQTDVKFGETVSYQRLAEMAGNPRAARAVGGAMRRNPSCIPLLSVCACARFLSSFPATESFRAVDRVGRT
ncbi:methylated-DNA--protein-cysteine methyltransferase isoform X3 [Platichthys flesus]|uniref:methylated-DNA--protein-cysteine methyltransferase isoform X3 n=1 Tax=Platichthys flesus TaxID=8260 RepID=UPI002DB71BEF|nr:methylated-DNA--protein-cysteine methyltransferase isoform X3 [Platichthys flesus]